jgi:hypothetical protein
MSLIQWCSSWILNPLNDGGGGLRFMNFHLGLQEIVNVFKFFLTVVWNLLAWLILAYLKSFSLMNWFTIQSLSFVIIIEFPVCALIMMASFCLSSSFISIKICYSLFPILLWDVLVCLLFIHSFIATWNLRITFWRGGK